MLSTVVIKFIAPSIELIPARWRLKIARSTDPPEWLCTPDRGGYTVHPVIRIYTELMYKLRLYLTKQKCVDMALASFLGYLVMANSR